MGDRELEIATTHHYIHQIKKICYDWLDTTSPFAYGNSSLISFPFPPSISISTSWAHRWRLALCGCGRWRATTRPFREPGARYSGLKTRLQQPVVLALAGGSAKGIRARPRRVTRARARVARALRAPPAARAVWFRLDVCTLSFNGCNVQVFALGECVLHITYF